MGGQLSKTGNASNKKTSVSSNTQTTEIGKRVSGAVRNSIKKPDANISRPGYKNVKSTTFSSTTSVCDIVSAAPVASSNTNGTSADPTNKINWYFLLNLWWSKMVRQVMRMYIYMTYTIEVKI